MKYVDWKDFLYLAALATIISLQLYFHYKAPATIQHGVEAALQELNQ